MIDAVVDDANVVTMDAEELFDVASCIVADGNDFVLAASEIFHDDAAVEHPGEIIFAGDAEWGEVMDGRDQGAGLAPHQASITGNVQDIKVEIADDSGQDGLMPANVVDGRAIFFRNADDFKAVVEIAEKFLVVLEDQQGETFAGGFGTEGAEEGEYVLCNSGFTALDDGG